MFKLQPNPSFSVAVQIPVPGKDIAPPINFEFKHLGRRALKEFVKNIKEEEKNDDFDPLPWLSQVVIGWEGVEKDYSLEAFDELLDQYPGAGFAILSKYVKESTEAKEKNSGR